MLCYVMLCYVMLCYVMLLIYYITSHHIILHYIILNYTTYIVSLLCNFVTSYNLHYIIIYYCAACSRRLVAADPIAVWSIVSIAEAAVMNQHVASLCPKFQQPFMQSAMLIAYALLQAHAGAGR